MNVTLPDGSVHCVTCTADCLRVAALAGHRLPLTPSNVRWLNSLHLTPQMPERPEAIAGAGAGDGRAGIEVRRSR